MNNMFRRKVGFGPYSTRMGRKNRYKERTFPWVFSNLSVEAQKQKLENLKEACENKLLQR
jgi:hypothetical protein